MCITHLTADRVCLFSNYFHLAADCIYPNIPCSQTLYLSFLETKVFELSLGGRCGLGMVRSGTRKLGPFSISA